MSTQMALPAVGTVPMSCQSVAAPAGPNQEGPDQIDLSDVACSQTIQVATEHRPVSAR